MKGQLFIVSAPSGTGKTSVLRRVVAEMDRLCISVSHTTRDIRKAEEDGRDYHFVSEQAFLTMREDRDFLEWAEVFGRLYGTSRRWVDEQLLSGRDVILEIDWQGARQVRASFGGVSVGVFFVPPSYSELAERLVQRRSDSRDTILQRLSQARGDIEHFDEYEYVIINDHFDTAVCQLKSIIVAARLRSSVQRSEIEKLNKQAPDWQSIVPRA